MVELSVMVRKLISKQIKTIRMFMSGAILFAEKLVAPLKIKL